MQNVNRDFNSIAWGVQTNGGVAEGAPARHCPNNSGPGSMAMVGWITIGLAIVIADNNDEWLNDYLMTLMNCQIRCIRRFPAVANGRWLCCSAGSLP
jgi:hypothetical protein